VLAAVVLSSACAQAIAAVPASRLTSVPPPTASPAPLPRLAVVLHGFASTAHIFATTQPGLSLIEGLEAQGWKVIVPEEPFNSDPARVRVELYKGGVQYRKLWDTMFRHDLMAAGPFSTVMVVGISWGGLHALIAACDNPIVSALVVHDPVVDAANLTELSGLSLPGLSLQGCTGRLSTLKGEMSYATKDTIVGVAPSVALANAIASPTMSTVAELQPHETTNDDVMLMLNAALWVING
jgi:pimeloyl-ACP methyl ester carboxylesterase